MALAWNICAPLGTLSAFFFLSPVFQLSTAKNEINLFNNHILIVAPVTFAPAGAMTPSAEFLLYSKTGVYRGIHYFSYFCSKHRLWVLVRTTAVRWS